MLSICTFVSYTCALAILVAICPSMACLLTMLVGASATEVELFLAVTCWPRMPLMRALVAEIGERVESYSQNFLTGFSFALNFVPSFATGSCSDFCL